MSKNPMLAPVRRVVTGIDAQGRSTVVADGPTAPCVTRPDGSVVMDVWRCDQLPPDVDGDADRTETVAAPATGGLVYRLCWVAPNADMDAEAYGTALAEAYGQESAEVVLPGGHRTDTVDVVTVVSGEVYAVLETGETLLRPGDSLVQRGTLHAWHNRGDQPALIVSIMMGARR